MIDNGMTYVAWEQRAPSPKLLSRADIPAMRASGCWFARKFDGNVDAAAMDELDRITGRA